MKATLSANGMLEIQAETGTESYALKFWLTNYTPCAIDDLQQDETASAIPSGLFVNPSPVSRVRQGFAAPVPLVP